MNYIILSQKKDFKSEYKDELFKLYHFPAAYRSRINTGDIFIYNQPKQGSPGGSNIRYYYGTGVVGEIFTKDNGITYYAELKHCKAFYNNVPLKFDNEDYIEQLGFEGKRVKPNWQSSIRLLSEEAYKTIINASGGLRAVSSDANIEDLKVDLKDHIDNFYLRNDHQALIEIMSYALKLSQTYGVLIK